MNDATLTSIVMLGSTMIVGLLFGIAYFHALRRTVDLVSEGRQWVRAVALTGTRIIGAIVLLTFMAWLGAVPLLMGFLGFILARMIALRPARRVG